MGAGGNWLLNYLKDRGLVPADNTAVAPPRIPAINTIGAANPVQTPLPLGTSGPATNGPGGTFGLNPETLPPFLRSSAQEGRQFAHDLNSGNFVDAALLAGAQLPIPEGWAEKLLAKGVPPMFKRWAILTAENPGGKEASKAANARAMRSLERTVGRTVPKRMRVLGQYVDPDTKNALQETSLFLEDVDPEYAEELGRKYGQNSIITPLGMHDLGTNTIRPTRGPIKAVAQHVKLVNGKEQPVTGTFFLNKDGTPGRGFVADYNFKNAGAPLEHEFDHYSAHTNLKYLDPRFAGTGQTGREALRERRLPVMHVYEGGTRPEYQFEHLPKYRVPVRGVIYDIAEDPSKLMDMIRKQYDSRYGGTMDLTDFMEKKLRDMGFAGFKNSYGPGSNIVKLFGKHRVFKAK